MALLGQQSFERVKELFLRTVFVGEKLYVVDQQKIERVIALLELIKGAALVSLDHIRDKLFSVDVENLGIRTVFQQLVAHSMYQVGFTQTHTPVDKQWVVQVSGRSRHVHGRRACHAVGSTFHQRFKGQGRVQAGAESRCRRLFRCGIGRQQRRHFCRRAALGLIGAHISACHAFTLSEC